MSIKERIRKLRRMKFDEISSRLTSKWNQVQERLTWRSASQQNVDVQAQSVVSSCQRVVQAAQDWEQNSINTIFNSEIENLNKNHLRNANELLCGEYSLFGTPAVATNKWDWHTDWLTGYKWDKKFYADVRIYNLPKHADVKRPWELSRHQYFFDLAASWRLSDDEKFALTLRELWLDWIAENRLYEGVNWTSGLEVAIRSISWIWAFAISSAWRDWAENDIASIVSSMVEHAKYLDSHFSYFSSPFNHLIGEATGLLLLSEVLSDHPRSNHWRDRATKALEDFVSRQFYRDGFSSEQAVSYHYFTLGFLTLAVLSARRIGRPLESVERWTHAAFRTGLQFRCPDGQWPPIGDLDSARAMPVNVLDFWDFGSLSNCGALLFEDATLACGKNAGSELFWLWGLGGLQKFHAMQPVECDGTHKSHSIVLEDSGYAIARRGEDWLLFDSGSISAGLFHDSTPSTGHGHADTLQLLYYSEGQSILQDSGIPFYNGDPEWIRYFRSPAAHNTLEVDGVKLVHPEARLAWSREVARPELAATFNDDVWLMHGKVTWTSVKINRYVLGMPGIAIWIADYILTDSPRLATWYWQLPYVAGTHPVFADRGRQSLEWDDYRIVRQCITGSESQLITSREGQPHGWRCHGYGRKAPGSVLVFKQMVPANCLVLTSIGRTQRPEVGIELYSETISQLGGPVAQWQLGDCRWKLH